jgi:hypothetical protein
MAIFLADFGLDFMKTDDHSMLELVCRYISENEEEE